MSNPPQGLFRSLSSFTTRLTQSPITPLRSPDEPTDTVLGLSHEIEYRRRQHWHGLSPREGAEIADRSLMQEVERSFEEAREAGTPFPSTFQNTLRRRLGRAVELAVGARERGEGREQMEAELQESRDLISRANVAPGEDLPSYSPPDELEYQEFRDPMARGSVAAGEHLPQYTPPSDQALPEFHQGIPDYRPTERQLLIELHRRRWLIIFCRDESKVFLEEPLGLTQHRPTEKQLLQELLRRNWITPRYAINGELVAQALPYNREDPQAGRAFFGIPQDVQERNPAGGRNTPLPLHQPPTHHNHDPAHCHSSLLLGAQFIEDALLIHLSTRIRAARLAGQQISEMNEIQSRIELRQLIRCVRDGVLSGREEGEGRGGNGGREATGARLHRSDSGYGVDVESEM
ncbi:hypothetical protein P154DRAFT_569264 [Amniculicola lignicola CBS 123094]|uniref:Uncharacterized protein n=1 Tax=Amniculicola lignicola CBS 123094 TaxID=1392246 RepID=A0A6A5X393_9PLEO|nr:hypothetical protein P154DRAFT_569264 [Amniculicola lignicola CBS 123094]